MSRRLPILLSALFVLGAMSPPLGPFVPEAAAQQTTPCDLGGGGDARMLSAPPKYEPMPQQLVELQSAAGGATIQIGLVRPKVPRGVRVPVIVDASPYFHAMDILNYRDCEPFLVDNFVPQGYAVALVPIRGTSNNGGCMNLMGPLERGDLDQAVTWLGTQPWSNGSVGMIGVSYDGSTPWEVASFGNPHLKTIVPEEGVPSLFDLMYRGGTADWRGPAVLSGIYYLQSVVFYAPGRSIQHTMEQTACPQYVVGNAAGVYSTVTGTLDPLGYWAEREYLDDVLRNYRGSIFLVQGLQDWNVNPGVQYPLVQQAASRGLYVKQLLGQWGHTRAAYADPPDQRADYANILLAWFDRWLYGRKAKLGPRVQVEDSLGKWRNESTWPPRGDRVGWWLTRNGSLSTKPSPSEGSMTLAFDPVHLQEPSQGQNGGIFPPEAVHGVCAQPVCASFATPRMMSEYRISGIPRLRLTVTPSGPTGDVSAHLYAERGGEHSLIGWGKVDLRFPTGGGEPRPVTPGEPMVLDFALQPLDAVVQAGERLVLILSEGNTYNRLPSAPPFPVTLHIGGQDSGLRLVRVHPKRSQFFVPPKPADI
ncbi:MAG: CocE/NonD family hydrolase [Actinomycetota bacterium]